MARIGTISPPTTPTIRVGSPAPRTSSPRPVGKRVVKTVRPVGRPKKIHRITRDVATLTPSAQVATAQAARLGKPVAPQRSDAEGQMLTALNNALSGQQPTASWWEKNKGWALPVGGLTVAGIALYFILRK